MNFTIQLPEMPVRIRFDEALSDCDLLEFCGQNESLRIERDANGEYILMSPNSPSGASIEAELLIELANWARLDGRGKYFGSTAGFTLPDNSMRAPDACWVSLKCWNALTDPQQNSFSPICPEFIIEVRSKSDRLKLLQEKMQMWLGNGAELAWLIDPQRKVVEVYRAGEAPEIHEDPTSVLGTGPVAGFELVLSRIWS